MIELSCVVSAARRCPFPAQPGTSPARGSQLSPAPAAPRAARPPLCPPLQQSDGAEGARRVPRPAPLGDGRLRQPRRAGGRRRRPKAGRGFRRRQMHLQVPEPPDHPHLRLLQAFPGRGMAPRRDPPPPSGERVSPGARGGGGKDGRGRGLANLGTAPPGHGQHLEAPDRWARPRGSAEPRRCLWVPAGLPAWRGSWLALPWLLAGARRSRPLPPVCPGRARRGAPGPAVRSSCRAAGGDPAGSACLRAGAPAAAGGSLPQPGGKV